MWETFTSRHVITAHLRAESALRIGAGGDDAAQPAASDLPVLLDANDRPFIPGGSLRGVLRSQIERIVRTVEGDKQGACNPTVDEEWCIPSITMKEIRDTIRRDAKVTNKDKALADQIIERTCRVCRLFGSAWLASRVRIQDLHLVPGTTAPIQQRDGVSIDRDKETVQHKYDFETVARDSIFQMTITAENLSEAERGLLWLGLRELDEGHILLGGFKGRGLGRAKLVDLTTKGIDATNRTALRDYILHGELQPLETTHWDEWLETLWNELAPEEQAG